MRGKGLYLHEKEIYRILNAVLLSCAVLFGAGRFLGISGLAAPHLLCAFGVLALFAALSLLAARGRILCLGAAGAFLCAWSVSAGNAALSFLGGYLPWLLRGSAAGPEQALDYELLQSAVLTAACCLLQYLCEKFPMKILSRGRVPMGKLMTALSFLGLLLYCLFTETSMSHLGVVFLLGYLALVCVEWVQSGWEKVRRGSARAHMFRIMPFLAGYLALMALMPVPEAPYQWQWAQGVYLKLKDSFLEFTQNLAWGDGEGFDMRLSGFSEDGGLHGSVSDNAREIMSVRIENGRRENLYLTGRVYDTFDGRQWTQESHDHGQWGYLDAMESFLAVQYYDEAHRRDYLEDFRLRIRYYDIKTAYVFAPLKTYELGEAADYGFDGGSLVWEKRRGYGTEYRVRYYQMNAGGEEFYRFLESGRKAEEALNEEALREYNRGRERKFGLSDLEAYREEVYGTYLGETILSPEAERRLAGMTGEAETDAEKLRAIERELASWDYTRTPGKLPEEIGSPGEFLDYFLLENPRGYCTYFATAFVLLARAEGIPARYVQGFCVPVEKPGEVSVRSHMAHAWPEAYIRGVGWVPFEPTPGYGELRYRTWGTGRNDQGEPAGETPAPPQEKEAEEPEETPEESAKSAEKGKPAWAEALGWLALYFLPAAIVLSGLLLWLENLSQARRYRRMSMEEKFRTEVGRNLHILSWLGLEREKQETLQEFRERALLRWEQWEEAPAGAAHGPGEKDRAESRKGTEEAGEALFRFLTDYEELVYGGKEAGQEALEGTVKEQRRLLELLKKKRRLAWLYCRVRKFIF